MLRLPAASHGFVHAGGDVFESTDPATGELAEFTETKHLNFDGKPTLW
jgi:hypothetical protein